MQAQLDGIMQQGQQLEAQQQKLIEGERTLQTKVESFRTQKEVIKAQYSAAEAQVRIGEAATGIGEQMADVGLAIQRAKDKTEQMQARANAIDELTAAGALEDFTSSGDDIDRQLAQISQSAPGRRRAREDEGRARPGGPPKELAGGDAKDAQPASGEPTEAVIVRLMGEGQWRVDDSVAAQLNELDEEVGRAVEAGDEAALWRGPAGARRRGARRTARSSTTPISRRPTRSSRRRICRSRRHASCSKAKG